MNSKQYLLIVILTFLFVSNIFAAGELDTSFNASLSTPALGRITATALQPDGKIIAYGSFSSVSGTPINANPIGPTLVRINPDGTLDTSFNAPFIAPSSQVIPDIALQSNGKIIVAGGFGTVGGQTIWGIVRLNPDGSLDPTFTINNFTSTFVWDVDVLSDDKIIVPYGQGLRRLLPDGAIDPTFAANSTFYIEVGYQSDGKILAATANTNILSRFNVDGTPDPTFTAATFDARVWDIRVQADGKVLVGGQFTTLNGFGRRAIARVNSDGSGDATFTSPFSSGFVFKLIPQSDGKIYAGGSNLSPSNLNLYKLNANGTLDTSFNHTNVIQVWDIEQQSDGKLIASGNTLDSFQGSPRMYRLNLNGSNDTSFNANFGFNGFGRKIYVQPDGKILIAGKFYLANNALRTGIVRFNADGAVDTSFNALFTYTEQDIWSSIDLQPDGKIFVGDEYDFFNVRRLNPDGSENAAFFNSSRAYDIKVLTSGKILIAGNNYLRLYNSNGTLDNTFNVNINGLVRKIAVQADGKILICGIFSAVNSVNRGNVARLNADGTLDTSFDSSTGANTFVHDVVALSSGQVLIGGAFTGYNFVNRPHVARLNSNGSLDTSFTPAPNDTVVTVKVQPDNKVLIGGLFATVNTVSRGRIARLNQDGTLDVSFNPGTGADAAIYDIEYQSDGKILIAGDFTRYNGVLKYGIARLNNSISVSKTLFDYDGDAKADVSVFRPSTNRWYVFKSSDSTVSEATFGLAGDIAAPADYDGDNKTDLGIFRGSSGDWWYQSSINGAQISVHWGASGDVPRPSDFDQDGKADFIVFRPSNNVWYRLGSTGATSITPFGLSGDKPVSGDFDGDGKSDLAIFRPSAGTWWYQSSINGAQLAVQWGISTDVPAPADFDGDGKTDFAVYRPSTGVWYVINSSNGSFLIMAFGVAEDKPVPADYDGDGKADIAVFRPSTGIWYQMKTTAGFAAQQFGVSTDVPTENAFVP